ncbi:hypothetical protein L21SP4_02368 [Kiritimatiella glycovorans]|uniref:Uncharacterized protein n=2 Tax=Kiritimatiella glycovorans TaxID=1307763 RepID=A0A0G3EN66_9BACT|nr:hypothetical protein L21SP4_02368 [Kiritimatiella glycovorans]
MPSEKAGHPSLLRHRPVRILLGGLLALSTVSCTTTGPSSGRGRGPGEEPDLSEMLIPTRQVTRYVVTRSGDRTIINWDTQQGLVYSVYYSTGGKRWSALPGAQRIRGTGGQVRVHDTADEGSRQYRIMRAREDR